MADRVTHGHFETFARARLEFVRNIAALSERPEYLEVSYFFGLGLLFNPEDESSLRYI